MRSALTECAPGSDGVRRTVPSGTCTTSSEIVSSTAHVNASARASTGSVVVGGCGAGAADHDLVLVDRDLDGTVTRPVLGVHGVVGDGRVEPQPVALLAVVERALERSAVAAGGAAATATAPAAALGLLVGVGVGVGLGAVGTVGVVLVAGGLGLLGLRGLGGVELGGDERVVLGAQVDLVVEVRAVGRSTSPSASPARA
jgi:hypothetical protein